MTKFRRTVDTVGMDIEKVKQWIEEHGDVSFSRSSGPGGQKVNKTSTKALLRISIKDLEGVSEEERLRLLDKLRGRLTVNGDLQVQVQDERSQLVNRLLATERILETLEKALYRDKPRKKTKPTKASKERRLKAKKINTANKQARIAKEE